MFFIQSFMFNLTKSITMTAHSACGHTVILQLSKVSSVARERNHVNLFPELPFDYYLKLPHLSKAHKQFKRQLENSLAECLFIYNNILLKDSCIIKRSNKG